MPDIREILAALSIDHRALWSEQRTIMRRSYLNAHNQTVGIGNWTHEDDAFMDLIDIRLALLFDRAGLLETTKEVIGNGDKIEEDLKVAEDALKLKTGTGKSASLVLSIDMSEASKKLASEGWSSNV